MTSHTVTISNTNEQYSCKETQHLLAGMVQLGIKGIPVGCRGGGCGVCKVQILSGRYQTKKMSRERVTEDEEKSGIVLACRVFPQSAIQLLALGHLDRVVKAT